MRKLGIIALILVLFAGVIKAEEEVAALLVPPNYDYFEYAADSNKYLKDWVKFLNAVMAQKAEGAPEFTFVSLYDAGLPTYMGSFTDIMVIGRKATPFNNSYSAKMFLQTLFPQLTNYQFPDDLKSQPVIGVLPDNKIVIYSIIFSNIRSAQDTLTLYPDKSFNINVGPAFSAGDSTFGLIVAISKDYSSALNGIIASLSYDATAFNGIAAGLFNNAQFSRYFSMQAGLSNHLGNNNGINFQAGLANVSERSGCANIQCGVYNNCDQINGFSLQAGIANTAEGDGFGIQIGLLNDNGFFYMPIINFVF